jgi:endonuclease/exonuclease/phosphatase family metal-dependent hydrolase
MRFKIISYNLKSLELCNLTKLSNFLIKQQADIICLQETESSIEGIDLDNDILKLSTIINKKSDRNYQCRFSKTVNRFRKSAKYGITILSAYHILNFQEFYYHHKKYERRCCQLIEICVGNLPLKIYHTHLGWQTNQEIQELQLQEFWNFRDEKGYSILCGDLNINAYKMNTCKILVDLKKKYQDTEMTLYTYPATKPIYRYDYILLSKSIMEELHPTYYYRVVQSFNSDHLPIVCSVYLPNAICQ